MKEEIQQNLAITTSRLDLPHAVGLKRSRLPGQNPNADGSARPTKHYIPILNISKRLKDFPIMSLPSMGAANLSINILFREELDYYYFPRLPCHYLQLKEGAPIILLRNINQSQGLCNGTRLVVVRMGDKHFAMQGVIFDCKLINRFESQLLEGKVYWFHRVNIIQADKKYRMVPHHYQLLFTHVVPNSCSMVVRDSQGFQITSTQKKLATSIKSANFSIAQLLIISNAKRIWIPDYRTVHQGTYFRLVARILAINVKEIQYESCKNCGNITISQLW
ncbi:hypothetical protein M9H77_16839 [Catharanthus roseus]|uniref:Uncharacterized protein n=1 Tax=Catharanthus roseus TaxID=4058 RepID=A0ACC0B2X7_CATRO|nr:hypothetical protein M9H77_16839 [Catharanthus roseus]